MRFVDLLDRRPATPWPPGNGIPWQEPGFSARVLREHLSQEHDRGSRRFATIDRHVSWLHHAVLGAEAARILDLGCGPGLYASRLGALGHRCVGIDFSPASIAYAKEATESLGGRCEFRLEDLRVADFGQGHDAILLLFGEFNSFAPEEGRDLLSRARRALSPGGALVLEVQEADSVRATGEAEATWEVASRSVFSDTAHLRLCENTWHAALRVATERSFVFPLAGGPADVFTNTTQAYTDDEYAQLLHEAGFQTIGHHESLWGVAPSAESGLTVLVARSEGSA